ncbi:recombinase family protein [Oscillospiraceae bacterium PP1C4]
MAKKLDAERIERERQKKQRVSQREESRRKMQEAFDSNRRGERKVRYIPPVKQEETSDSAAPLRAAAYVRVSTQEEQQVGSFEMQKKHFLEVIENNPRYQLAGMYCDEGISGTQVHNRKEFQKMMEDAQAGKIDIILTKDITRLGRNTVDILTSLQTLDTLNPPVPVILETNGIDTSDGRHKLLISILSALAELESQQKSEAIKAGIRWRMQEGIYKFSVVNTLGYFRDYTGAVKIEPAAAEIVQYIYDSFLEGSSPQDIADALMEQGFESPKHMERWRGGTIKCILSNEKYCGDVLYQKTYTKDFLTHKSVKNRDTLGQYYWEDCHPAIIERANWQQAQILLREKKWNKQSLHPKDMPKRFVAAKVKSGTLRGYYLLDASWNKEEREQFINIITSINELEGS